MPEPGWVRDPSGRYHQRYFDGIGWTEHVADEWGRRAVDPVAAVQQARTEVAPAAYQPPTGQQPVLPAVAAAQLPQQQPVAALRGMTAGAALTLAGSLVAFVAICFLPWFEGARTTQLSGFPIGESSVRTTLQSSWFESGWVVTLIALFTASVAVLGAPRRRAWIAAAPVIVCTVWGAVMTVWIRGDLDATLAYGFFVAMVGLVVVCCGVLLATLGQRATLAR